MSDARGLQSSVTIDKRTELADAFEAAVNQVLSAYGQPSIRQKPTLLTNEAAVGAI